MVRQQTLAGSSMARQPQPLSSRNRLLLNEVAEYTGEMDGLQKKLDRVRAELCQPDGDDDAVLEAERTLAEYFQVQKQKSAKGPARRISAGELLSLAEAEASPRAKKPERGASLSDYLPASSPAAASRPARVANENFRTGCPAASSQHRAHRLARSSLPPRCECNVRLLEPHVLELERIVEGREAEIRDLKRELWSKCVASPDLAALASENGKLAIIRCENAEHVAALRVEGASLIRAVDADHERTRELQVERQMLTDKIGKLGKQQDEARDSCRAAECRIESEKHRLADRAKGQEEVLEALVQDVRSAEQRWTEAETATAHLEVQEASVEADASAGSRASVRQGIQQRQQVAELGCQLKEERHRLENPGFKPLHRGELDEAEARVSELRNTQAALTARLAESRRRSEETEQKALDIARELVDSSHALSWLSAEVEEKREMRVEFQDISCRNGQLRLSVQDLHQAGLADMSASAAREVELEHARIEKARAVNDALGVAWEAAAREHRTVQQGLEELQSQTLPLHKYFTRLAEAVRHWREDFVRTRCLPGSNVRLREPEISQLRHRLPLPPELDLEHDDSVTRAGQSLCACFEALARESSRWLNEADSERMLRDNTENLLLQAEQLALREELERIAPRRVRSESGQITDICSANGVSALQASGALSGQRNSSATSSPRSHSHVAGRPLQGRSEHGGRVDLSMTGALANSPRSSGTRTPVAEQAGHSSDVHASARLPPRRPSLPPNSDVLPAKTEPAITNWPASPIPRPRDTRNAAALPAPGIDNGIVRNSSASSLSSVSLHDRRTSFSPASLPAQAPHYKETEPTMLHPAAEASELDVSSCSDVNGGSAAKRRREELQRQVNRLTRQALRPGRQGGSLGPMYHIDNSASAHPGSALRLSGTKGVRAATPQRKALGAAPALQQSALSNISDDLSERFDGYSLHGPKLNIGLL